MHRLVGEQAGRQVIFFLADDLLVGVIFLFLGEVGGRIKS